MKQIIWVFGTSASGKETFIRELLHNKELQGRFGITDKKIALSEQSLKNLGALGDLRTTILQEVTSLLTTNEVVLIKWQYGDTLLNTPNQLQAQLPTLYHEVINLKVEQNEQIRRLRTKSWWYDTSKEPQFITREQQIVIKSLAKLPHAFTIVNFNW